MFIACKIVIDGIKCCVSEKKNNLAKADNGTPNYEAFF